VADLGMLAHLDPFRRASADRLEQDAVRHAISDVVQSAPGPIRSRSSPRCPSSRRWQPCSGPRAANGRWSRARARRARHQRGQRAVARRRSGARASVSSAVFSRTRRASPGGSGLRASAACAALRRSMARTRSVMRGGLSRIVGGATLQALDGVLRVAVPVSITTAACGWRCSTWSSSQCRRGLASSDRRHRRTSPEEAAAPAPGPRRPPRAPHSPLAPARLRSRADGGSSSTTRMVKARRWEVVRNRRRRSFVLLSRRPLVRLDGERNVQLQHLTQIEHRWMGPAPCGARLP